MLGKKTLLTLNGIYFGTVEEYNGELANISQASSLARASVLPEISPRYILELIARFLGIGGDLSNLKDVALRIVIREAYKMLVMSDANMKMVANKVRKKVGIVAQQKLPPSSRIMAIREAVFLTWKIMVKSGDIADKMRDAQAGKDDTDTTGKVTQLVLASVTEGTTAKEIVNLSMIAVRDVTF